MTTALVISRWFPTNDQMVEGVIQRLETQVEALARIADRIDCLFLTVATRQFSPEEVRAHEEFLRRRWSTKVSLTIAPVVRYKPPVTRWQYYGPGIFNFHSQQVVSILNNEAAALAVRTALRTAPDLIFAHRLPTMSILMKLSRDVGHTPVFFDLDDIEHVFLARRLLRQPAWLAERLMLLQIPRLLLAEIQAIRRSRLTFVCSEHDWRYLRRLGCSRRVEVVANSVLLPPYASGASEPVVLFVGIMSYLPNALAADTLVRDIWPIVHARVPNAHLIIAGKHPELLRSYPATDPSVTLAGFVENLAELYAKARVICCPIVYGGGTRIKIIEAAAHARAVVSTKLGAEGLAFENEREIVVRDGVAPLAEACVRLLQDPAAAERLGLAARERARATYERSAVVAQLERLFTRGLAARRVSGPPNGSAAERSSS
jgi:glycosyltransferase involved in cell wall biosynthesis